MGGGYETIVLIGTTVFASALIPSASYALTSFSVYLTHRNW